MSGANWQPALALRSQLMHGNGRFPLARTTDGYQIERLMVRRQIQNAAYTVVLEGSNWDSAQAERDCLQQDVLRGVAGLQVDVAGAACRTISLFGSAKDRSEDDSGRCLRYGFLPERGVAKLPAKIPHSYGLQSMISSDIAVESFACRQVKLKRVQRTC